MRSAGNFSAEWGYMAPAPSFARTARVVLVATAIGAIAGAGVVFSLIERPGEPEKTPVAARAIVTSVRATAIPSPALAANGPAANVPAANVPAANGPTVTASSAGAAKPSPPGPALPVAAVAPSAKPEPPQPAVAMTMPPTPPQLPAPTRPVSLTRSIAAHPPGVAPGPGAPSAPVLRGRAVIAPAAPAPAPAITAPAPPKAPNALASANPATAVPAAPASGPDAASASPTASGSGGAEPVASAPVAPTDANGNPSIVAPETVPPKKDKHHASGKKGQSPGIGTILRRFFVAHSGRTYYPSNRGGLSN